MPMFEWDSKYEIGVPSMDEQHKRWIEIINDFYDHLTSREIVENTKHLIEEVIDYTTYHFASEEELMKSIGYPHINEQKAMHRNIVDKILEFKKKINNGKLVVSSVVTIELKQWLRDHILIEDKKYAELYKTMKQ